MQDEKNNITKDELTGDELLVNHDYDGIQELNNPMPKWWLWIFYISIIFAVVYMVRYHVMKTGDLQDEEYAKEMADAVMKMKPKASTELSAFNVTILTDEVSIIAGKAIFDKNCMVCHLAKGEGLVGPNLTDKYWIHGGSIGDIYKIIEVGNSSKGMISWKGQLTPKQIQEVGSFILSLQGSNPPNAKAPEGELYTAE